MNLYYSQATKDIQKSKWILSKQGSVQPPPLYNSIVVTPFTEGILWELPSMEKAESDQVGWQAIQRYFWKDNLWRLLYKKICENKIILEVTE